MLAVLQRRIGTAKGERVLCNGIVYRVLCNGIVYRVRV